ncbi:hypothetical protein, partial [Nonomuraea pusilla]
MTSLTSRRALFTAGGLGGLAVLAPSVAFADEAAELKDPVYEAATVAELLAVRPEKVPAGTLVRVAG